MAHEHFTAHPDKLRNLSRDFKHVEGRIQGQIHQFAKRAENVDDAFGVLSESTEALAKYVEMTRATVKSLQQLHQQLAAYAVGLDRTAANYEHTDAEHAAALKGK
ncbi:type VII secretion target [Streptomyces platensis]|uniref:WXG100 family type VII secretion target n=1 Tax=Streptomyces platensis TaxID=58346 RepID=UPI002E25FAEC|nr:type VII secretion target [Streptomyces platensis]WTI51085.1 type VII secretion target [Streptomyces platensis]WUB83371.1 type VII secretion target [Streptomyces platensis]